GWLVFMEDWLCDVDAEFVQRALNPTKTTFLHVVIETYIQNSLEYLVRKGDHEDVESQLRYFVDAYGVVAPAKPPVPTDDDWDEFTSHIEALHKVVERDCIPRVTDEVFTILFADRACLRELSLIIADCIAKFTLQNHPNLLDADGVVKRATYWPEWLKSALLYRDRGRCALCLKDISGLLAAGKDQHIDHIMPLAAGGTNDPTNLQYLCEQCNLIKGAGAANTSRHYSLYW
ncbi:MAG TPA: HNH endonuclease, partial [Candidatus Krumholzibacteria bacterium]